MLRWGRSDYAGNVGSRERKQPSVKAKQKESDDHAKYMERTIFSKQFERIFTRKTQPCSTVLDVFQSFLGAHVLL